MYAVRLHAFGPAENLVHERVDDPEPGAGQVRIKVTAAGVHLIDTALRAGKRLGPVPPPELPTIPGREVAGRVEAVGAGVGDEWLGRRVVAHLGMVPGGYAELAVVGVEKLHPLPDKVSDDHAVAMIGTGRTTMAILRLADISPADTVLVLAAAGGIGTLLVQYAKQAGAYVVGAAGGPAKVDAVRELGADLAIDYRQPDWADRIRKELGDRPATYVFEGVGGALGRGAVELLAEGGSHLSYGYAATGFDPDGQVTLTEEELKRRRISSRSALGAIGHVRELEDEAMALVAARTLVPLVHHFPLADAARAHRALETRGTVGKVVLVP